MSSNLESFNTQIQSLVANLVISPLVTWLQTEKKVDVTAEELFEVLRIPKTQKPLTVVQPNSSQPPIPLSTLGTGSVSFTETKRVARPKSKGTQPTIDNYTGPTCKYTFKRGENKGLACGKPVSSGEYCDACNNKKTTTARTSESKKTAVAEEKSPAQTGFTNTSVPKRTEELSKKKKKIELREVSPNTYLDVQTNFIVKKVVDKENTIYVAIGVQEEKGFRTLTEEEKKEALGRNFTLQANNEKEQKSEQKPALGALKSSIPDIESDTE